MNTDSALAYDPIAQAEKITGKRWSDDPTGDTSHLGFVLAMAHSSHKNGPLASQDDTRLGITFADFKCIIADEGFIPSLEEPTVNGDTLVIYWHPKYSILIVSESYRAGDSINAAKMYYNIKDRRDDGALYKAMSSGRFMDGVLIGDHDIREGFRHKLSKLKLAGDFLPQWIERPFLWLLSYSDTKKPDYDHKAINAARITKLDTAIQKAITP